MRLVPHMQAAWIARCLGRGELAPLSVSDVDMLARSIEPKVLATGERLFGQGERSRRVWIVREGELELAHKSGGKRRVVQVLHAGDVVGDVEMFLGRPHAFGAWAAQSAVVLGLSRRDFDTLIAGHPKVAKRWLGSLAARLESSQRRIFNLLEGDLRSRVARLLVDEAEDDVVHLPQATLAGLIGARRPSLNRVLKELEAQGVVELAYRTVTIVDRRTLNELAGSVAAA